MHGPNGPWLPSAQQRFRSTWEGGGGAVPRLFLTAAQAGEHAEVFEGGSVTFDFRAGGNLLEEATHNFT
jgi:hypothetical protein